MDRRLPAGTSLFLIRAARSRPAAGRRDGPQTHRSQGLGAGQGPAPGAEAKSVPRTRLPLCLSGNALAPCPPPRARPTQGSRGARPTCPGRGVCPGPASPQKPFAGGAEPPSPAVTHPHPPQYREGGRAGPQPPSPSFSRTDGGPGGRQPPREPPRALGGWETALPRGAAELPPALSLGSRLPVPRRPPPHPPPQRPPRPPGLGARILTAAARTALPSPLGAGGGGHRGCSGPAPLGAVRGGGWGG